MLNIFVLLAVVAFICAILSATTPHCPLWVAVILLCIIELLRALPLGR